MEKTDFPRNAITFEPMKKGASNLDQNLRLDEFYYLSGTEKVWVELKGHKI